MTVPLSDIAKIIGLQLGIHDVKSADHIIQDLSAESMDIVNIIATIEEKYDIYIDESALVNIGTVAELHKLVEQITAEKESAATDHDA